MFASPGARADNSLPAARHSDNSSWIDRSVAAVARRKVLDNLAGWTIGRLTVVLPDGAVTVLGRADAEPHATVHIVRDRFFRRLILHGDLGAGDAYLDGDWFADDLALVAELALRNQQHAPIDSPLSTLMNAADTWRHRRRRNTVSGSRRNIHAHYDLGNAFFSLFLDPTMAYSSAVYDTPDETLESAQQAKIRRWGERLAPRPGDHVLEIGSGWGAMAIHLARTYGCRVTSVTVSAEQQRLATARVAEADLADRVDIQLRDYRELTGQYSHVLSVEMIEAVGQEFWPAFFRTLDRVLAPGGRIGLQAIAIPDGRFDTYARRSDWIQKHIFPGGLLPCLREICAVTAAHTRLAVIGVEDRPLDYARTLLAWRRRFMAAQTEVAALGFDQRFVRTWEYYLASCEAAFRTRNLGLLHLTLARPGEDLA